MTTAITEDTVVYDTSKMSYAERMELRASADFAGNVRLCAALMRIGMYVVSRSEMTGDFDVVVYINEDADRGTVMAIRSMRSGRIEFDVVWKRRPRAWIPDDEIFLDFRRGG